MKKLLNVLLVASLVLCMTGCKDKSDKKDGGTTGNQNETKEYTMSELKDMVKNAGYIVNDYVACFTGLTDDQMEGFTVEISKSAEETGSYCVIVAKSEDYAKQACETVSSEFNICLRSGKTVAFPEYNASSDVIKMLTSIIEGKPTEPVKYEAQDTTK